MFLNLCELYPETKSNLKELSLHKREIYMHFLNVVKKMKDTIKHSGVPRGIDSSRNKDNGRNMIQLSDRKQNNPKTEVLQ